MKLRTKELRRAQREAAVISVVRKMIVEKQSIWSVKLIQDLVKNETGCIVPAYMTRSILKKKFNLSYKKIRRIPFTGNLERNKVLRSLYAQKMLKVY